MRPPDRYIVSPLTCSHSRFAYSVGRLCWHSSMNRLEQSPVLGWRHPGATLEKPSKERRILVPDREADPIDGLVRRFEQTLRLFDAKVLHVVDEREASGQFEAPLQCSLWNLSVANDPRDDTTLTEVPAQPFFATAYHGISVRLLAHKRLEW